MISTQHSVVEGTGEVRGEAPAAARKEFVVLVFPTLKRGATFGCACGAEVFCFPQVSATSARSWGHPAIQENLF